MAYLIPDNLKSRRDIPPAAGSFFRLLGEALHDSATAWYEPLFDVRGDRPDVVVLIPDAGVLVVELLQQKASAVVEAADGHLIIVEDGVRASRDDPLRRARRFASDLASLVRDAGIEPGDELPVAAMGVFPYLDLDTANAKGILSIIEVDQCLFRDDLDRISRDLAGARRAVALAMAAPTRHLISDQAERLYRAVIHPDTVIAPVQMVLPELDVRIGLDVKALDREQENLAKRLGEGHRVVRGVAGSGKTVILLHRARLLAQLQPRNRMLVTCYNRALQGWLEGQLESHRNVKVRTLGMELSRVLRMVDAPPPDFDRETYEQVAGRALEVLDRLGHQARSQLFDHVLVDEAQDFGPESLRFATRLLRDGSDSLMVVADAAQALYRRGFTWKDAGIQATGRTTVLKRNYRNPREVLEYAWSFLSRGGLDTREGDDDRSDVVVPPEAAVRSGAFPLFRYHPSPDAEVLDIAGEVRKWLDAGESPRDVAVLYGSRLAGGFPWVDKLRLAFDHAGVPWYWPTDPDHPNKQLVGSRHDAVLICTIHSAKGLEFENVILCGYLDDRPPEDPEQNRRLVYVGMTRATERLVLMASGHHPYIADLEQGLAID